MNGMDVLCITDHNETAGAFVAEKYAKCFDDIEVVIGEEVMTSDGEIIGLFINEKIKMGLTIEETADIIKAQGGITIAPHPFSLHVSGLNENMFKVNIDGFEVLNGGHPDKYSNKFAQMVMDRHPGIWAPIAGSDGHSVRTVGYCWTEFVGRTAEDLRRAIKEKKTVPTGRTTPVLDAVKWSMEVVMGGQRLLYKSLAERLPNVEHSSLIEKINELPDLMKAIGIVGGFAYLFPPINFSATLMSTYYLRRGAKRMMRDMPKRLKDIDALIAEHLHVERNSNVDKRVV
jgi:predicted metal-dependent phosphoesterase TrpH